MSNANSEQNSPGGDAPHEAAAESQNKLPRVARTVPFKQRSESSAAATEASPAQAAPPPLKVKTPPASPLKEPATPQKQASLISEMSSTKADKRDPAAAKASPKIHADTMPTTPPSPAPSVKIQMAAKDSSPPTAPGKPAKIARPESWEDDIACNTLDVRPFVVNPPPSSPEFDITQVGRKADSLAPLMDGKPLDEFLANDTYPIPIAEDREGYNPGNDAAYWINGLEDCLKVLDVAKRHGVVPKTVLDFGCASGRVLRHYAAQTDIPDIWGTDINQRHVRWLYEHLPRSVRPVFNHCIPSLPMRDGSVDIITAFSVFTHIDTFETHWLAELARIMSDDGFCYLTVHNEDTWDRLRLEMDNENNRLIQSILKIDPAFKTEIERPMPAGRRVYRFTQSGPYRAQVFHSDCYLRNVWGRFFDVAAIMPCHHVRQSVVVLRKKS